MLITIKKLTVPNVLLRYIMMNFLYVKSIEILILTVKEMNVLDEHGKDFLIKAKTGFI